MSEIKTPAARLVSPLPTLLRPPLGGSVDCSMPLTPRIIWELVTDFVLSQTDNAAQEIEQIDFELHYLAPLIVPCGDSDGDAMGARLVWLHIERGAHAATLARLGLWRRCALFGISAAELTPRIPELWELAHEVCADRPEWQWSGLEVADLVEAMVAHHGWDTDDDE